MTIIFDEEYSCPLCGKTYLSPTVGSSSYGYLDSEFRIHSFGFNPLRFSLHICPHCKYPTKDPYEELTSEQKTRIKKILENKIGDIHVDKELLYKFLVYVRLIKELGYPNYLIADAYLTAAWVADDLRSSERKNLRKYALDYFIKSLSDDVNLTKEKIQLITYIIGELYRRLGEFEKSVEWFQKVKTRNKKFRKLVKRQKTLALQKNFKRRYLEDDEKPW